MLARMIKERTAYLAKLIGLYCLIVGILAAVQKEAWIATVTQVTHSPALMLVLGVATLAAGLAIVLGHNVWSGGAAAVIVTLVGWISTLKGIGLLLVSLTGYTDLMSGADYSQLFFAYMGIDIVIGAYLIYAGFRNRGV
jgi:hypothetical protein